jgi:hypothetical protein
MIGINLRELTAQLENEGVEKFNQPYDQLLQAIEEKKARTAVQVLCALIRSLSMKNALLAGLAHWPVKRRLAFGVVPDRLRHLSPRPGHGLMISGKPFRHQAILVGHGPADPRGRIVFRPEPAPEIKERDDQLPGSADRRPENTAGRRDGHRRPDAAVAACRQGNGQ